MADGWKVKENDATGVSSEVMWEKGEDENKWRGRMS